MANWLVLWKIDIEDVDTPREAAEKALQIQRDPESIATCFTVQEVTWPAAQGASVLGDAVEVDLEEEAPERPVSGHHVEMWLGPGAYFGWQCFTCKQEQGGYDEFSDAEAAGMKHVEEAE